MLQVWLESLRTNSTVKKVLCLNDSILNELLNELQELQIPKLTFVIAKPVSIPDVPIGVVTSYYIDGYVNRPTSIRRVGNEWWISSYYLPVARYDENFSFLGYVGHYTNPITGEGYAGTYGFAIDTTRDLFVVACYGYNCVKCYQYSTMTHLWTAGTGSPGDVAQGRLDNPYHVDFLPTTGNVIVSCYEGHGRDELGTDGTGLGHITEIDVNTGAIIASRIQNINGGRPWYNSIDHPTRFEIVDNNIYVASYTTNVVGVWDIQTWQNIDCYTKPKDVDINALNITGIYIDQESNEIIGCLNGPKTIAALGLDDHDLKWYSGIPMWDDRNNAQNTPGTVLSVFDIEKYDSDRYVVCDYSNNRVTALRKSNYIDVQYTFDTPEGYETMEDYLPKDFNLETMTRHIRIDEYMTDPCNKTLEFIVPIRKCD